VLERAAVAAEAQPFTAPRDDQWIYTEDRVTVGDATRTWRTWHQANGVGFALIGEDGELEVETDERPQGAYDSYKAVAALPTDPDALMRWAYDYTATVDGVTAATKDGVAYSIFGGILDSTGVLPPAVKSAVFRAMQKIPGVTLETTRVLGRPTYALIYADPALRQEILLDTDTYGYAGKRTVTLQDDPAEGAVAGQTAIGARIAAGVVDAPGRRP
jgi:hypothetical protein